LIPENWDMEIQFSVLGGIVLEYESTIGQNKVNYKISYQITTGMEAINSS
jgi:hypothetical protein